MVSDSEISHCTEEYGENINDEDGMAIAEMLELHQSGLDPYHQAPARGSDTGSNPRSEGSSPGTSTISEGSSSSSSSSLKDKKKHKRMESPLASQFGNVEEVEEISSKRARTGGTCSTVREHSMIRNGEI